MFSRFFQRKPPHPTKQYSSNTRIPPVELDEVAGRPAWFEVFDGTWNSIDEIPSNFPTLWTMIGSKPTWGAAAFSNQYSDLDGCPTLFDGTWLSLIGKPTTWPWADLTGVPAFFDGTWASLTGKPTIPVIQRIRAQTNTAGVYVWTFPVAYGTGVFPIVNVTVESALTDPIIPKIVVTNLAVTVTLIRQTPSVISLLGLTLFGSNASPQAYVHLTATAP